VSDIHWFVYQLDTMQVGSRNCLLLLITATWDPITYLPSTHFVENTSGPALTVSTSSLLICDMLLSLLLRRWKL